MRRFSTVRALLGGRSRLIPLAGLAAASVLVGCSSGGDQQSQANRPAVQASDVTHIPEQTQTFAMNFPTGESQSSVLRVEQVSPREVRSGAEFSYQVRLINLTDRPLQNVVLRATQPEGFRVTNASQGAPTAQDSAAKSSDHWQSYNVGNLGPRETRVFSIAGIASGQMTVRQTYDVAYEQQMQAAINVTAPAITVTKQGPSDVDVCQAIDWTYNVRNSGSGVARHVMLRDTLPDGLVTQEGQNAVAADLGDIPQGQNRQVVAHLKAARSGQFASAASVQSDAGPARSESVTTTARQPKLEVAIKGPEQEYLGKPVTYQAVIRNTGDAPARRAMFRLNAPGGAQLVGINEEGGARLASADANGESLGTIDPGQSRTITVTLQPTQGGAVQVEAGVMAQCADRVVASAQTNIMTVPALLLEAVDVQDPVRVGDNVVYRIKVTNQGTGPDSNINVTAKLPDGEQFIKASGVTEGKNDGQSITFAPVTTLGAKQSATWEVTAKAVKAGDVQFQVSATSDSVKVPAGKTEPTKLY